MVGKNVQPTKIPGGLFSGSCVWRDIRGNNLTHLRSSLEWIY